MNNALPNVRSSSIPRTLYTCHVNIDMSIFSSAIWLLHVLSLGSMVDEDLTKTHDRPVLGLRLGFGPGLGLTLP